jgi:hypothetical protein
MGQSEPFDPFRFVDPDLATAVAAEADAYADLHADDEAITPDLFAPYAKSAATKKFYEQLLAVGVPDDVAHAVSRIVANPTHARKALELLEELPTPNGTLLALRTSVYSAAVMINPANGRCATGWSYPANNGTPGPRPLTVSTYNGSNRTLAITGTDRQHFIAALAKSRSIVLKGNDHSSSIGEKGVFETLMLAPANLVDGKDTTLATVFTAVDGSSRSASCHKLHGLTEDRVAFGLATNTQGLRNYVNALHDKLVGSDEELSQADRAKLRSLVVPAVIIIGFIPKVGTNAEPDFAAAIRAKVGSMHVEPPRPWGSAAEASARAVNILEALVETGQITQAEYHWLAGHLSVAEAEAQGFSPYADVRAATALYYFLHPSYTRTVIHVINTLSPASSSATATKVKRTEAAVELALRSWPFADNAPERTSVSSSLNRAYRSPKLQNQAGPGKLNWSVTSRDLSTLLAAALQELDKGLPGPASHELGVLGGYWLAVHQVLTRAKIRGTISDPRETDTLLMDLISSRHGQVLLAKNIERCRQGLKPALVDHTGNVETGPTGNPVVLTADSLRAVVPSPAAVNAGPDNVPSALTPAELYEHSWSQVELAVASLDRAMTELRSIQDDDAAPSAPRSLSDTTGIDPTRVDPQVITVRAAADALVKLSWVWSTANPDSSTD